MLKPYIAMPDGEQKRRLDRATRDGRREVPGPESSTESIVEALRAEGMLEPVEDAYRIEGRTHVVTDDDRHDSRDPDKSLLSEGYDVTASGKAWFPVRVQTSGGSLERTRRFIARRGFVAYWLTSPTMWLAPGRSRRRRSERQSAGRATTRAGALLCSPQAGHAFTGP